MDKQKYCMQHSDDCSSSEFAAKLSAEELEQIRSLYTSDEDNRRLAVGAAETERQLCGKFTRVEETIEFAKQIGAKKIGIATCVGLLSESRTLARILKKQGFEVFGVCCKVGSIDKTCLGITEEQLAGFKTGRKMCNPVLQAKLLKEENCDLNILMGLCAGHDSIFIKYSTGPCTSLVIKDRVLGNNPAAALYTVNSFYKHLLEPQTTPAAKKFLAEREAERAESEV